MAGFNLIRNARAFFTTNVSATDGTVTASGALNTNTFELQLMSGFSFSQNTTNQVVIVSEAGTAPARSQRSFNTALEPVDFTFSTYIRPTGTTTVNCEERVLWNALLSSKAIDTAGTSLAAVTTFTRTASSNTVSFTCTAFDFATAGFAVNDVITISSILGADAQEWNTAATVTAIAGTTAACTGLTIVYLTAPAGVATAPSTVPTTLKIHKGAITQNLAAGTEAAYLLAHSGGSNKNQLQTFGMVIVIDTVTYFIDNCVLDQAAIEFGLDGIAMVAWTGKASALRQVAQTTDTAGTLSGGYAGTYLAKVTAAKFITNKLSTVTLKSTFRGAGTSPASYVVALTGGNLTIANNVTYVTPEIMGTVNKPITYFTGTRSITGSLNAYLKSGSTNTGGLLSQLLTDAATITEPKFYTEIHVGGSANAVRVELEMPAVSLQIPTIDAGSDILSTVINFTAQGFDGALSTAAGLSAAAYDVEGSNDLLVRYYSAA